ncbi:MAG: hypothetical protein IKT65_00455 [Clostridia bacterium]|nr:hypothetical protein [Clostridia bacterium]
MSLRSFIPDLWSETLYKALDKEYIAVKNCSREFEGDVKTKGDCVKIVGLNPISVFDYTANTDMQAPEELSDSLRTLNITQAKAFNFIVDDIDNAQSIPGLMQEAMRLAASALSDVADKHVYSLHSEVASENTLTAESLSKEGVVDFLLSARQKLLERNVPGNEDIILEVSPAVASLITKAQILSGTNNEQALDKGCIGRFLGFKIYVSNNVFAVGEVYKCFARTKRAVAFAEQINEVEAYRPESRFADAVKGLHLYGAKIVYPNELLLLNITPAAEG